MSNAGKVEVLSAREVPLGGPRAMTVWRTLPRRVGEAPCADQRAFCPALARYLTKHAEFADITDQVDRDVLKWLAADRRRTRQGSENR
ncbi:hypothetical protein [Amycolatopsis speibonae]|uniref:Uncharacterized protein n=1 Tax=Amycolatopsis speibonae TaxID=1450224 RepID=A0ABV7P338_9PSEU